VKEALANEEVSFNRTLDRGMHLFESVAKSGQKFPPEEAFKLYDTFGFPVDLTALLCRERGLSLDEDAVEAYMEAQRERARAAQKSTVVRALDLKTDAKTDFVGFDQHDCEACILEVHAQGDEVLVITDKTVLFTEMGGQEGDLGSAIIDGQTHPITRVQKIGNATAHVFEGVDASTFDVGHLMLIKLDTERRAPIEAHHTATHLLHWALHEVVSAEATQQGSSVSPDRLRFDFNSKALSPDQIEAMEAKVNAAIKEDATVSWTELPYAEVKGRPDIMQFFGDKYGDRVRVVQIGGEAQSLSGYSMELCGGTHVNHTAKIGRFKIKSEGAIAAGVRRIEAVCGEAADAYLREEAAKEAEAKTHAAEKLSVTNDALKALGAEPFQVSASASSEEIKAAVVEADKTLKKVQAASAAKVACELTEALDFSANHTITAEGSPALLQELINAFKQEQFQQAAFFIVDDGDKLHLGALVGKASELNAGELIRNLAPLAGGKGGGKPDMARGAAPERDQIRLLETKAREALNLAS